MTKDVLVKISGLQFAEDQDNGPVEIITTGNYYKKNGKHYILYDEVQEGFDGVTKSVIKVNDDFGYYVIVKKVIKTQSEDEDHIRSF